MKIGIQKRLSIIFTYGGQWRGLNEVLELISKGIIQPQVETAGLREFPNILNTMERSKSALPCYMSSTPTIAH